ncbi:MAG: DUF4384 domain-containing protein [Thermodesulfobacteriota bacterium]|nr:DUF4384 domain-containing protein [Thermodesulfobacteriota bacterium]
MRYLFRSIFIVFFLISLPAASFASFSSYPPTWINDHQNGSLKQAGLYHGVSFADFKGDTPGYDDIRLAKDRALDELCCQLSVSVKSQFKENFCQQGNFDEQHVASSLFVSTRKTLSGIIQKAKWTDSKKHRYWVLVVIDKKSADRQVKQQKFINEVVDRLENRQDEILKGTKEIANILNRNMKAFDDRMVQLQDLLKTIEKKTDASGESTRKEYADIRSQIEQLEKTKKQHLSQIENTQQQQSQKIDELISQNKEFKNLLNKIAGSIKNDYFLALTDDDVKHSGENRSFKVRIESDKGQGADYYNGEKIKFKIRASRDCYIKVIYLSCVGKGRKTQTINTLLFPNVHDQNNRVRAGETKVIGKLGELEVQAPFGKDVITVIASEKQFTDIKETLRKAVDGYYSKTVSSTRGAVAFRGVGVVQPANLPVGAQHQGTTAATHIATDTCFIVSHTK